MFSYVKKYQSNFLKVVKIYHSNFPPILYNRLIKLRKEHPQGGRLNKVMKKSTGKLLNKTYEHVSTMINIYKKSPRDTKYSLISSERTQGKDFVSTLFYIGEISEEEFFEWSDKFNDLY